MSTLAFSIGGVTVPTLSSNHALPGSGQTGQYVVSGSGTVAARFRLFGAHDGPYAQIGDDIEIVGTDLASVFLPFPFPQTNAAWQYKVEVVDIIGTGATAQAYMDGS